MKCGRKTVMDSWEEMLEQHVVVYFVFWDMDFRYGLKITFWYCDGAWRIDISFQISDI
jgi:hypothetical protein